MKIEFAGISINNFKSFVGPAAVIDLDELRIGLHFVRGINQREPRLGSNGSGKSSIFDALCWCLYGKSPGGLKNPDIRPWTGKGRTVVTVDLIVDGEPHAVTRTATPNRLTVDGTEAGGDDVSGLLGMSYDLFVNTIIYGQGQPLFFDLKPMAKMQLFVDVLDLERWDQRSAKAAEQVTLLNQDHVAAFAEHDVASASLAQLDKLLATARDESAEWENKRSTAQSELNAVLKSDSTVLAKIIPMLAKATLDNDGAEVELRAIVRDRGKLRQKLAAAELLVSKDKNRISGLVGQQREIQSLLDQLGTTDNCPVCGQSIKGTSLAKHKRTETERIAMLQDEIDLGVPKKLTTDVASIQLAIDRMDKDEAAFQKKSDAAGTEIQRLGPQEAEIKVRISATEKTLSDWDKQANPYDNQISTMKKRRGTLARQVADLQDEIKKLLARIERTKFWVRGFKDIRLFIIEDVLQELELTTNAGLEDIGLVGWSVQYAIEKENKSGTVTRGLTVFIQSPEYKEPVRWESWSGGESQRLRLVGALALSEVLLNYAGVQPNLEVLDEPTRGLGAEGIRDLCDYLADRAKQLNRITMYVDHNSIESARFMSVITVTKDKSGSHL